MAATCDVGDHLERVQLVFAQVGSLGSLPQFNHTGLPELCIRGETQRGREKKNKHGVMTNSQRQLGASPVLTHTHRRERAFKRSSSGRCFLSRYNHSSRC